MVSNVGVGTISDMTLLVSLPTSCHRFQRRFLVSLVFSVGFQRRVLCLFLGSCLQKWNLESASRPYKLRHCVGLPVSCLVPPLSKCTFTVKYSVDVSTLCVDSYVSSRVASRCFVGWIWNWNRRCDAKCRFDDVVSYGIQRLICYTHFNSHKKCPVTGKHSAFA